MPPAAQPPPASRDGASAPASSNNYGQEKLSKRGGASMPNDALLRLFLAQLPNLVAVVDHGEDANGWMDAHERDHGRRYRRFPMPHFASRGKGISNERIDRLAIEIRVDDLAACHSFLPCRGFP